MMWSLWIKDFKTYMADRQAVFTVFLMPVVISTILGFSLQAMFGTAGGVSNTEPLKLAVVRSYGGQPAYTFEAFMSELSGHPIGAQIVSEMGASKLKSYFDDVDPEKIFIEDFLSAPELKSIMSFVMTDQAEADQLLEADKITGILVLPGNYISGMYINLLTPLRSEIGLQFIENPDRTVSTKIAKLMLDGFAKYMDSLIDNKNVMIEQQIAADLTLDSVDWTTRPENLLKLEERGLRALKPVDSKGYYTIAMLSMFLLFTAALGGYLLLEEKKQLTYDRQRVAGLSGWSILFGKLALIYAIASIQIALMIGWSALIFRVQWGSAGHVLMISAAAVVGIGGLGLLFMTVAAAFDSFMISKVFENGINQVLALIGGAYIPIETMPGILQKLSLIPINGVILKAYLYNMMGYSFSELLPYVGLILLNGAVFTAVALVIFKLKEVKPHADHTLSTPVDAESVV